VGAWGDAEATFRELTALMPASPWAAGRLSKALARQGKHDEALVAAKHALDLSPTSLEARLEYGSRLIDAGKVADAVTQLQPLASAPAARGEHLLRLGWAQWLLGNVEGAGASFEKALAVSTLPGDWRTKGRASYDLALVEAKRGKPDAARAALRVALQTGLKLRTVDPLLATAARELERAEASPDAGGALALKPTVLPREASLFPVDTFGDVDPAAKKPPPPEGLVLGRF
jgi:predicted Zn-dependent protease